MDLRAAIAFIESEVGDPSRGLPEEVFLFASRIVPMINIDLLIKDEDGRTFLSWRDDEFAGKGWHIPGGIIMVKEKAEERIKKVIEKEIDDLPVEYEKEPMAINEIVHSRPTRGHFISLLYRAFLSKKYRINIGGQRKGERGFLKWHRGSPDDLIPVHNIYRKYL